MIKEEFNVQYTRSTVYAALYRGRDDKYEKIGKSWRKRSEIKLVQGQ